MPGRPAARRVCYTTAAGGALSVPVAQFATMVARQLPLQLGDSSRVVFVATGLAETSLLDNFGAHFLSVRQQDVCTVQRSVGLAVRPCLLAALLGLCRFFFCRLVCISIAFFSRLFCYKVPARTSVAAFPNELLAATARRSSRWWPSLASVSLASTAVEGSAA